MGEFDYDLLVIGSGPSGQKAAIQASKLGRRVAIVERMDRVGGVSIHLGTIPSKTLREAVVELLRRRSIDVSASSPASEDWESLGATYLRDRSARVVAQEAQVIREQFRRNRVNVLLGEASFVDPHTVQVDDGRATHPPQISAEHIVIAVGTAPARPASIPFDDEDVLDSDAILDIRKRIPRTLTVVGAGIIGVEYASIFAALGTKVTLVDARERLLPWADGEIAEALQYQLRRSGVTFRFNEEVVGVDRRGELVVTNLKSGKRVPSDTVLFAIGRQGATAELRLDLAGLKADKRGRLDVDDCGRTQVKHIYAVGDVAGPPGLAATAFEQGRIAALDACAQPTARLPELMPTGVYAIPELGLVGRTEEELTDAAIPYVTGVARWSELARGLISGDEDGMLKLIVSPDDRSLLGVHIIGTGAADLVHVGQALIGRPNAADYLVSAVFNYPTFAESYKVAALDAVNRMRILGWLEEQELDTVPLPDYAKASSASANGASRVEAPPPAESTP